MIEGLFINALYSVLQYAAGGIWHRFLGKDIIDSRQQKETALAPILKDAADDVAQTIEQTGVAEIDQIATFIVSPEVKNILEQIFCDSILGMQQESITQIEQKFCGLFALHTGIAEEKLQSSASQIFQSLLKGCEKTLNEAIDRDSISALDAKMRLYHRDSKNHLQEIKSLIALLAQSSQLDIKAVFEFVTNYRQQLVELHGKLTPPFFDAENEVPIERIYVAPKFSKFNSSTGDRDRKQQIIDFDIVQVSNLAVVLGDPGSGKSAYAQKLIYELANNPPLKQIRERQVTPVLVILRDYAAYQQQAECSLLRFIEITLEFKYQLVSPTNGLEYLLFNGHLIVIFDGLDELLDPQDRRKIRDKIHQFCTRYPSAKVLVTSRVVGYSEAPLDQDKFKVYQLAEFKEHQIIEYVTKWFSLNKQLDVNIKNRKISAFLQESKDLIELRSNPLLLALMCNVYKTEGHIPRSRAEVYQKCTNMLLVRWDKSIKQLEFPLAVKQIETKIEKLMGYLANWIYADNNLEKGVTEERLIDKAAQFLFPKFINDIDDAKSVAQTFFHFCQSRAWIFTSIGIDNKYGQQLFRFTHRTFLEYFTAYNYVRIYPNLNDFLDTVLEHIKQKDSLLVCQIAVQIKNKHLIDAEDEIFIYLMEAAENEKEVLEKISIFYFILNCLEFIVPSYQIIEKITQKALDVVIECTLKSKTLDKKEAVKLINFSVRPWLALDGLIKAHFENRKNISSYLEKQLEEKINQSQNEELNIYLEISDYFNSGNIKILDNCFITRNKEKFVQQARHDAYIGTIALYSKFISLSEFIEFHGIECCLYIFSSSFNNFSSRVSIGVDLLYDYFNNVPSQEYRGSCIEELNHLGKCFMQTSFPLRLNTDEMEFHESDWLLGNYTISGQDGDDRFAEIVKPYPNALFAAFIIFAVFLELDYSIEEALNEDNVYFEEDSSILNKVFNHEIPFFTYVRHILISHYRSPDKYQKEIESELNRCHFNSQQRAIVWSWINLEYMLIMPEH